MIVLIHDGSFNGFLTCIYECYYSYKNTSLIFSKHSFEENLLYEKKYIATDDVKANKVYTSLLKNTGEEVVENIYYAYLSDTKDCFSLAFKYIQLAFKLGSLINHHVYDSRVKNILALRNKVLKETHMFEGFVRFSLINDQMLYSSIEPDHNILELLSYHFTKRFCNENFIIHDIKRELALVYSSLQSDYEIISMSINYYDALKNYKEDITQLWKTYYNSTTISSRQNLRLQSNKMPKRYWKHLLETK